MYLPSGTEACIYCIASCSSRFSLHIIIPSLLQRWRWRWRGHPLLCSLPSTLSHSPSSFCLPRTSFAFIFDSWSPALSIRLYHLFSGSGSGPSSCRKTSIYIFSDSWKEGWLLRGVSNTGDGIHVSLEISPWLSLDLTAQWCHIRSALTLRQNTQRWMTSFSCVHTHTHTQFKRSLEMITLYTIVLEWPLLLVNLACCYTLVCLSPCEALGLPAGRRTPPSTTHTAELHNTHVKYSKRTWSDSDNLFYWFRFKFNQAF